MSPLLHTAGERYYAPRFVQMPEAELAKLGRTIPRVGAAATVLAVPAWLATGILPHFVVPDEAPAEMWLLLAGTIVGAVACGAAGSVLSTRRAVRAGYLDLWLARSARAGLAGTCVVSIVAGGAAVLLLVRMAPTVGFGALVWAYLAALVVAVAVNCTCFLRMRPLLWAGPGVIAYRGYRIAPWEKRR